MTKPKPKSDALYVRVTGETKQKLAEVASRVGMTPSEVLRELVTGLIEGRVTVAPPENPKGSLYNVTGK